MHDDIGTKCRHWQPGRDTRTYGTLTQARFDPRNRFVSRGQGAVPGFA